MKMLKKAGPVGLLLISIILTAVIELVCFQSDTIIRKITGPAPFAADLQTCPDYNGDAIVIMPETGTVSIAGLSGKTANVTLTFAGPNALTTGTVSLCDESTPNKTAGAGWFAVNPGGKNNSATVRLNSRGDISRLRVTINDAEEPIFLTSVTFNSASVSLSYGRIVLMLLICLITLLAIRCEWYAVDFDPSCKKHRILSLCSLCAALLIVGFVFLAGKAGQGILKELPTAEELSSYGEEAAYVADAYAEQMDAMIKGQLHLDLAVNPAMETIDNVYDRAQLLSNNIAYHWDRAFYNGKYYSYFGLAPIFMVYGPVYLLTGKLPVEYVTLTVLAAFAVICLFFAIRSLMKRFSLRANLLLYLIGFPAVCFAGCLYMLQSNQSFYYFPVLSGLGWLMAAIAVVPQVNPTSQDKLSKKDLPLNICRFALCGLCIVMIVLSRPNLVLPAVAFLAPLFLMILFGKERKLSQKAAYALSFLIPVAIGGALICRYNYMRFGSVTDFGTAYQLTVSDIRYNSFAFSLHHVKSMLYHYFAQPLVPQEFFPYILIANNECYDFGNFMYQAVNVGLLTLPMNFGLFLAGCTIFNKQKKAPLQKATYAAVIVSMLMLGYLDYIMGGIHVRYMCDLALVAGVISLLLIFEHINWSNVKSGRILYTIALAAMIATIVIGFLMIFSNESNFIRDLNPDMYLKVMRMFRG